MPISLQNSQVLATVENIWSTVLNMEVSTSEEAITPADMQKRASCFVTSCIQLTGAWEGSVLLYTTHQLARQMAAVMFGMEAEELQEDDIKDSMGELGNITAGNLKLMLPKTCELSLPAVVDGCDYRIGVPGSAVTAELQLLCCDEPLLVTVLEKNGHAK